MWSRVGSEPRPSRRDEKSRAEPLSGGDGTQFAASRRHEGTDRTKPYNGPDGGTDPTVGRLHGARVGHTNGRSLQKEDTPPDHPHLPHPFVSTGTANEGEGPKR